MKTKFNNRKFSLRQIVASLITIQAVTVPAIGYADESVARESVMQRFPAARITEIKPKGFGRNKNYQVQYQIGQQHYKALIDQSGEVMEINAEGFDDSTFILGILARSDSSIYQGGKSESQVLPLLWYDNGRYYIKGKSLGYRFYKGWADVSLDADIAFGDGYDIEENPSVSDLPELDNAVDLGLLVEKELGDYELSLAVRTDVTSAHKGTSAELEFGREFELSDRWSLEIGANLTYRDDNYNDYYYGVAPQYARFDRPAYTAKSDIDTGVEIQVTGQLSDNWFSLLQVEYTAFGTQVSDSPLVDKDSETEITFGIGYRF